MSTTFNLASPFGFAGKLDPMAEGLMVYLQGSESKRVASYQHLSKTYRVSLIVGIESNTGDVLGHIKTTKQRIPVGDLEAIVSTLPSLTTQEIPPFSGLKHQGKPLWWHAKQGNQIHRVRSMRIYRARLIGQSQTNTSTLVEYASQTIPKVRGDFGQAEALASWYNLENEVHRTLDLEVSVSSGTYVRGISAWIATQLGQGVLVWKLQRVQVGPYHLRNHHEAIVRV